MQHTQQQHQHTQQQQQPQTTTFSSLSVWFLSVPGKSAMPLPQHHPLNPLAAPLSPLNPLKTPHRTIALAVGN